MAATCSTKQAKTTRDVRIDIKLTQEEKDRAQELAKEIYGVPLSTVIRALLAYAEQHHPSLLLTPRTKRGKAVAVPTNSIPLALSTYSRTALMYRQQ